MDQNNFSIQSEPPLRSPLRVAFDTSVLGYAQYGAGGRTGVFRVVENLARGLVRSQECDVAFCGGENFRMWVEARAFLTRDPELRAVPVLSYGSPARVYRFMGQFFWELASEKEIPFPARVLRRGLAQTLRSLDRKFVPLSPRSLQGQQVFHSSFYGLPKSTQGIAGLTRFLTVCDLINIQYPHYARGGADFLKSILETLHSDDAVVAISETTKNDLCAYRPDLDPARVRVVPLAASEIFYPVNEPLRIQSVKTKYSLYGNYFLSVCTLDPRKNMEGLVEAFCEWWVQEKPSDVQLVLAGYVGAAWPQIQAVLNKYAGAQDRVAVLGYVPDEDLAPLYSGALGFAYPSFYEGFGLPVLEAMRCGVPVITSQANALKEIAEGAALLVDPYRKEEIAQALGKIYGQSGERRRLREAGFLRSSHFSWEKSTTALLAAYRALSKV